MSNIQAALGVAQLERLDEFVSRKRRMGRVYTEALRNLSGIQLPVTRAEYADNIYWVYGIVIKDELKPDADEIMGLLGEKGVGTRPFFFPMHEQPVFRKMGLFEEERYPVSEKLFRKGFYIPSGLALTDEQMERVCGALKMIIKEKNH